MKSAENSARIPRSSLVLGLLLFLLIALPACSTRARMPEIPTLESSAKFEPIATEEWQLDNGVKVLFVEDNELPFVRGTLYLRGGALWANADEGVAIGAAGELMRSGGAGDLTPKELDYELEKLSAGISSSLGSEFGSVSFSCLSSDLDRVFELFSDVLLRPRFDQGKLELWRGQALEGIRRRVDDPQTVASISLNQLLFGGSPYGRVTTSAQVRGVTRVGLLKAHRRFVRPNEAIFAISGAVSREEIASLIARHLKEWAPRQEDFGAPPPVSKPKTAEVYFIEQPLEQATIIMGQQGPPRLTTDQFAIESFNEIFGTGGFSAKLIERIRTELGLAYVAYGAIVPGIVKGKNVIFLQTKNESVGQAIDESIKLLRSMQREDVDQADLDLTKRSLVSSYVFKFDSLDGAVTRQAWLELLGYPTDYDQNYIPNTLSVTPENVREVAAERWNIDELVVVVVGGKRAYTALKELGLSTIKRAKFKEKLVL